MSAIPNVNATGPIPAAHRTETPVWAFHHAINVTAWAIDTVAYRAQEWERRTIAKRPLLTAYVALGMVLTAIATGTAAIVGAL